MPRRSGTITVWLPRDRGRHRRPHVAGIGKAVQHDDRRARAADAGMDRGAAGVDFLRAEAGRKGMDH